MGSSKRGFKQRSHGLTGDYPANWPSIARRVKGAASWRCVRCFHPNERPWKAYGRAPVACDMACRHDMNGKQRMLTVHHLDLNKTNVNWWNLAALCQVCHLSIQGRVDWHQFYMLSHSSWMKPYLDGWQLSQLSNGEMLSIADLSQRDIDMDEVIVATAQQLAMFEALVA